MIIEKKNHQKRDAQIDFYGFEETIKSMDRVIIKAQFDSLELLRHIEPYMKFYNNFLSFTRNDMLYIEITEDSLILCYKDVESFNKLLKPLPDRAALKIDPDQHIKEPFIFKAFFPRKKFPKNGLHINFSLVEGPYDIARERGIMYLKWMDPAIEFVDWTENNLKGAKVFLPTYESLLSYSKVLVYKYLIKSV